MHPKLVTIGRATRVYADGVRLKDVMGVSVNHEPGHSVTAEVRLHVHTVEHETYTEAELKAMGITPADFD